MLKAMSRALQHRRVPRRRPTFRHLQANLRRPRALVARTRAHLRDRIVFYSLLFSGVVVLAIAAWPFARAHLQAIAILQQVSGQPVPLLIRELTATSISTEDVTLEVESGNVRGRLYLPKDKPNAPALILLHGVHHLGIDEPRLRSFAASMASCGIRVLTPELPDIKDYHVDSTSMRTIGESAHWFAQRTGGPVGVMGLSFSGGLALVAAADPLYHTDFKFVFAVGSQDSMGRVAQYYGTGEDARPNGTTELLPAHEYGPLVLEYQYLEDFVPRRDVAAVRPVLRAHLYEDKTAEATAERNLNDSQRHAVLELMDANSPKTRDLIARSNSKHAAELNGLSPHAHLHAFTTPVYLLHGEADNIIPSAETLWMASELPSEALQAMLVSPVISHLDIGEVKPRLLDEWHLIHFFALVMHAAETSAGTTPL